jgi:hypothetical protein
MVRKTMTLACAFLTICCMTLPAVSQDQAKIPRVKLKSYHPASPVSPEAITRMAHEELNSAGQAVPPSTSPLPLAHWAFRVNSGRDGNNYSGLIVGSSGLSSSSGSTSIPTEIIPVIVKTVALGTGVDNNTGAITIATGKATDKTIFDPTKADNSCLASPNNIPTTVFAQSPLFQTADFNFGGTDMGTTQSTDAFQRASFWNTINQSQYHVLLGPVKTFPAVTLSVPAPSGGVGGLALDLPTLLPGTCGRIGLVDINTIDNFVVTQLSMLAARGVNPKNFPTFMFYNTAFTLGDPSTLASCCAGGYHFAVNVGTDASPVFQTYAPFDFDMTGFFLNDTGASVFDIQEASHEVAEWMNDPLGGNPTPAWGNVGQDIGVCQSNLEVGDPLSGLEAPRIAMPNGFTYHTQELAFFSWFYGAINGGPASIGLHNWFSDNATFLTNAGPPCQ